MSSIPAAISRQHTGSTAHSTLAPAYERRLIRIAHGIQFHPNQQPLGWGVNEHLDSLLPSHPYVVKVSESEYRNHQQRVIFDLEETTSKAVFRQWLETPELHVIYSGHARHGRGPCFGRADRSAMHTQDWGEGTNPATTGAFRLGFPYIGIALSEIEEHGYTAHLLKETEGVPDAEHCHPELRHYRRALQPIALDPGLVPYLRDHQSGDRYLAYRVAGVWKVVHHAGWRNTLSSPNDWAATRIRCRVFCHFGCSTFVHNYPIVRRIAQWRREGNERYAYWHTNAAYTFTTSRWVANLVTYNVENAFTSWEPSLHQAVQRTNSQIRAMRYRYQVI